MGCVDDYVLGICNCLKLEHVCISGKESATFGLTPDARKYQI